MLPKHAGRFGLQLDTYLPGVLWASRNPPHESMGKKPSFLLFAITSSPTFSEYRHGLLVSLSSARELAASTLKRAQQISKQTCAVSRQFKNGDWVLVRFRSECRNRKVSQPWHVPYRVLHQTDTNTAPRTAQPSQQSQVMTTRSSSGIWTWPLLSWQSIYHRGWGAN